MIINTRRIHYPNINLDLFHEDSETSVHIAIFNVFILILKQQKLLTQKITKILF